MSNYSKGIDRIQPEKIQEVMYGDVKVIHDYPPVWGSVCKAFQIIPKYAVFSYGDCVYNPSGQHLPDDIIEHEKVHLRQQKYSREEASLWFGKFLREPEFRISQEIEAYAEQYKYLCKQFSDRNKRFKVLHNLGSIMSGPIYNKCITCSEAMERIKKQSKVI